MYEHFIELRSKLRIIYKLLSAESVNPKAIEDGISAFCSELHEFFKDKENSDTYKNLIVKFFEYLENYLINKPTNKCMIEKCINVLIDNVTSAENDLPIWYSVLVLENVSRMYQMENLLSKIFCLLRKDKSSGRQIALVKVMVKHMNICIVKQHIKKTYNSEIEQLFSEVCSQEDNDMAARLFINKFNRFADNNMSFFCETIEISRNIVIWNQWIDFSRKRRQVSFLCPRKYLSENYFEDEEYDIIAITLFSINHLKIKRNDKPNFAELIVDLNEPCTGLLQSSTKSLKNYKTINFKVSKDVEEFRSFIVKFFKIKQASTSQDLESDIEYYRTTETLPDYSSNENNVIRGTGSSPWSSSPDEFIDVGSPEIRRNHSSPNISVQETEYESTETHSIYSDSQNDPITSALLATPKIQNTCVSVAETVASQTSDSIVRKIFSSSSIEIANREKNSGKLINAKIPRLTIRTPEVINSLQELHESENDDKKIKKRRLTTITNTIASDIEIDKTFAEGSIIELSSQTPKEKVEVFEKNQTCSNNKKQLECVTNPDIVSIIPDGVIQNNCTQSQKGSSRSRSLSQGSRTSAKTTPKKRRKSTLSNTKAEFKDTSFFSSSYKSQGEEIRTRTRVIKKPDFYDSGSEAETKRKRKPKKSAPKTPLSQLSTHSEPPKKRIKTILPVVRNAPSSNSSPATKNMLSSTTHSLNISSDDQNSDMDLFDRVKYGIASERSPAAGNLSISSCSQSSSQQDNTPPPRNLNFPAPQIINPESPISILSSPISPESNKTSRSDNNNNKKKRAPRRPKKTSPKTPDFVFTSLSDSSPETPKVKGKKSNVENNTEKKKRGRQPKSKAAGAFQEKIPKKPGRKRKVEGNLNPNFNFVLPSQDGISKEELDRNDRLIESQFNHAIQIIHTALLFPSRNGLKMLDRLGIVVRDFKAVLTVKK